MLRNSMACGILAAMMSATFVCYSNSLGAEPSIAKPAADRQAVLTTVERSLPYLVKKGDSWIKTRKCVSCHQIPFMVWSLNEAAKHGLSVEPEKLKSVNEWALDIANFREPKTRTPYDEDGTTKTNTDTIAFLSLAAEYAPKDLAKNPRRPSASHMLKHQESGGDWHPRGQLPSQKRPMLETREVTTMWAAIAIQREKLDAEKELSAADAFLGKVKNPTSIEWYAARSLYLREQQKTDAASSVIKQILSHQHADGGWGWLVKDKSDAMGTGLALYALASEKPSAARDEAIAKAREFLIASQKSDGHWSVNGTKKKGAKQATPTASYWGTAWAAIGLLNTLPE